MKTWCFICNSFLWVWDSPAQWSADEGLNPENEWTKFYGGWLPFYYCYIVGGRAGIFFSRGVNIPPLLTLMSLVRWRILSLSVLIISCHAAFVWESYRALIACCSLLFLVLSHFFYFSPAGGSGGDRGGDDDQLVARFKRSNNSNNKINIFHVWNEPSRKDRVGLQGWLK